MASCVPVRFVISDDAVRTYVDVDVDVVVDSSEY